MLSTLFRQIASDSFILFRLLGPCAMCDRSWAIQDNPKTTLFQVSELLSYTKINL